MCWACRGGLNQGLLRAGGPYGHRNPHRPGDGAWSAGEVHRATHALELDLDQGVAVRESSLPRGCRTQRE